MALLVPPVLTEALCRQIAEADDFGHCLECGADVHWLAALDGQVLCDPCDRIALDDIAAAAANPHRRELEARILATADSEPRYVHPVPDWVRGLPPIRRAA